VSTGRTKPLVLLAALAGCPGWPVESVVFINARNQACTLSSRRLGYATTFLVSDRQGQELRRDTYRARGPGGPARIPPGGSVRLLQVVDEYCWCTVYEVRAEDPPEVACEATTGRVVAGRREWFGWASWQRFAPGQGTGMRRLGRCTTLRYQDEPGEPD